MRKILLPIALTLLILQACSSGGSKKDAPMRETIKLSSDVMTPEVLWTMGRIGEFAVSSDGGKVVYTVSDYSIEGNSGFSRIYVMNADGTDNRCLTNGEFGEYSPAWTTDGEIGFMK